MEDSCFAIAPNSGFIYSTPKCWRGQNLGTDIEEFISKASRISCAAFGPGKENCVISWINQDGTQGLCWGDDTPSDLVDWLCDLETGATHTDIQLRVTLGPSGSFFAWDSKRVRWQNIPLGLEKAVQGWLGPAGWSLGPPRIVTLGTSGSYFAISEYGAATWNIPSRLTGLHKVWEELEKELVNGNFKWTDLEYVYFDSINADHYIICRQPSHSVTNIPEPKEPFYECYDTLLDDDLAERRRRARQEEREKREEKDRQAKAKKEAKRKRKEEEARRAEAQEAERIRREEEEVLAEDLQLKYVLWQSSWEADVRAKRLLTIFPHLPIAVCTCNEVSCKSRKVPGSLMACQHDVERFFRASGLYSLVWLRKERLLWHPDRFGQRCDPDFRVELRRKATELYAIFETLIVAEREREGIGDTRSPQASP